jgi:hypothetical protein
MAAQFQCLQNEIRLGNIRKQARQAKTLASRGLGQFPRSAADFAPRVVALAFRPIRHIALRYRFSAYFDSFVLSPRGLLLRNTVRSSALGHAIFDSDF